MAFVDVTAEAGIDILNTWGGVWADYDNDGWLDFVATYGERYFPDCDEDRDCEVLEGYICIDGRCRPPDHTGPLPHDLLWRNNGDGTFTEVSEEAGVYDYLPTNAAAWADYNQDGFVDLYMTNFEIGFRTANPSRDFLYRNNGDGTFTDVTDEVGMARGRYTCGWGANWGDYDNDGDQDLYVSNYRLQPNRLWRNNGDGTFTDVAREVGVDGVPVREGRGIYYGHTIGSAWGDFDNDGDLDLLAANLAHPRFIHFSDKTMLYLNSGPPDYVFTDIREQAGITYEELHAEPSWGDYDNDTLLDLFLSAVAWRIGFLYRNRGDLTFDETTYEAGVRVFGALGSTWIDLDDDGDLDLVTGSITGTDGSVYLNNVPNKGNWIKVKPVATVSNRAAIGTRVRVVAGPVSQIREVEGGKGSGSQSPFTQHFGLGRAERVKCIEVRWPSGRTSILQNVPANTTVVVNEDEAAGGECPPPDPAVDAGEGDVVPDGVAGTQEGCKCGLAGRRDSTYGLAGLLLVLAILAIVQLGRRSS